MKTLFGNYANANVYASIVGEETLSQIQTMIDSPVCEGATVAIMPDTHAGAGCTIGTTMTIGKRITPSIVGVDIGCGMMVVKIPKEIGDKVFDEQGLSKLDTFIKNKIPSGKNHREIEHKYSSTINWENLS